MWNESSLKLSQEAITSQNTRLCHTQLGIKETQNFRLLKLPCGHFVRLFSCTNTDIWRQTQLQVRPVQALSGGNNAVIFLPYTKRPTGKGSRNMQTNSCCPCVHQKLRPSSRPGALDWRQSSHAKAGSDRSTRWLPPVPCLRCQTKPPVLCRFPLLSHSTLFTSLGDSRSVSRYVSS